MEKIFIYNTLTRKKEEFTPIIPGEVGLYTCGPTVYNFAHLGNLRSYLFEDFLKRTLQYDGYKVKHVMNITDVGHLTGDMDMGEDKVEKVFNVCMKCVHCGEETKTPFNATEEAFNTGSFLNIKFCCESCGKENEMMHANGPMKNTYNGQSNLYLKKFERTAWQITEFYTKAFKNDMRMLNILEPDIWCKATENIPEQIALIKKLEEKGFTYKISDGIYFDTSKLADYNKLSHLDLETLREGARVEKNEEKKNPTDFALWKFSSQDEKRQMEWESPWGVGFPGWHIECSAMSLKFLGEQLDIHCGGIDHISVHHTNEIAQSEAATGKKFFNYWMHGAFLNIAGGKKMAKSAENFLTLERAFVSNNINPLAYRFAALQTHYRKPMEYNEEAILSAASGLNSLYDKIRGLGQEIGKIDENYKKKFLEKINDDLNFPEALAVLHEVLRSELSEADKLALALDFDLVLGLNFHEIISAREEKIPEEILALAGQRKKAREEKNWAESDRLRAEIERRGYAIEDGKDEIKIYKNDIKS